MRKEDREEEFPADDVAYLDGKMKQRVYVVPSRELVLVRVGEQARGWDDAYLPNAVPRGWKGDGGSRTVPRPSAAGS